MVGRAVAERGQNHQQNLRHPAVTGAVAETPTLPQRGLLCTTVGGMSLLLKSSILLHLLIERHLTHDVSRVPCAWIKLMVKSLQAP